MPTDTQILKPDVSAAPSTFVVGDNIEILLKAVHATFTDNGAGVAWLPAVVIRSDSGSKIAHAVDQNVSVSAGSGAEASFFRGVKHAAAAVAAAANLTWAMVSITFNDPGLAIGAANVPVPYDLTDGSDTIFLTSDGTVFSLDSVNHAILASQYAFYLVATSTRLRAVGTTNAGNFAKTVLSVAAVMPASGFISSYVGGYPTAVGYITGGLTFWDANSISADNAHVGGTGWQHWRTNNTGVSLVGQRSTMMAIKVGVDNPVGSTP